jgi:PAS domain-containing protein
LLVANSSGDIIATNHACTSALGWSKGEWFPQKFVKLSHPDDVTTLFEASTNLRDGFTGLNYETRFRHRDGTIGVESNLGQGSKFWFELRAIDTQPDKITELKKEEYSVVPLSDAKGTLFYIEDNDSNQRLMERTLGLRPGVTLMTAPGGETGVRLAHER